jgi:hypothetical protein
LRFRLERQEEDAMAGFEKIIIKNVSVWRVGGLKVKRRHWTMGMEMM